MPDHIRMLVSLCIASVLFLKAPTTALSQHAEFRIHDAKGFPQVGVTSLLTLPNSGRIFAGTKSGKVFYADYSDTPCWIEVEGFDSSKFPIFSLAAGAGILFCGGGDRFVSVWVEEKHGYSWSDRLGPHTGWVKALAFENESKQLFSIGCNCIEAWDCQDLATGFPHISKRSIENSPQQGCTLSSDLLSLCLLDDLRLLSGGVDGRVHVWSSDAKKTNPLLSSTLHDGRVNRIMLASPLGLVFSIGNDGKLVAVQVADDCMVEKASLLIKGAPRLTAGLLAEATANGCVLALGTAEGEIVIVKVLADSNNLDRGVSMTESQRCAIHEGTMVYALEKYRAQDGSTNLLVGHATGLAIVDDIKSRD